MNKPRLNLLILPILLLSTPASACHHYSRWYYPYPQPPCEAHTPPKWYVEITKIPPIDERTQAIEKLKSQMRDSK